MHQTELETLATKLSASPEYGVLRRINPRIEIAPDTGRPLLKGIVVAPETTDLDVSRGQIIEIGIVAFEYDPATRQPIPVLKPLLDRLPQVSYTLFALNSPYATKDLLKARKYRWDEDQKVWHRTVVGKQSFDEEVLWLKSEIYGGRPARIEVVERDARTRFSRKPVPKATQTI
jgi:hypothetical protein